MRFVLVLTKVRLEIYHCDSFTLKAGELNSSRLAANAVLGFCLVGKEGPKLFEQVTKQVDRELLLSNPSLLEAYVGLCRKYGKSDEVQSLREQYERRKFSTKP